MEAIKGLRPGLVCKGLLQFLPSNIGFIFLALPKSNCEITLCCTAHVFPNQNRFFISLFLGNSNLIVILFFKPLITFPLQVTDPLLASFLDTQFNLKYIFIFLPLTLKVCIVVIMFRNKSISLFITALCDLVRSMIWFIVLLIYCSFEFFFIENYVSQFVQLPPPVDWWRI